MEELDSDIIVKEDVKTSILDELGFKEVVEEVHKLILHNDHVNDMITVVVALMTICKLTEEESVNIMYEAHTKGKAIAKTGKKSEMELMRDGLKEFNLEATVES